MKPRLSVTMGDPAGVGAEVVVKALADPQTAGLASWRIVGDESVLESARRITGLDLPAGVEIVNPGRVFPEAPAFGELSVECGEAAVAYIRGATDLCLQGEADAMVTAPVNKEAVTMSGMAFTGHRVHRRALRGGRYTDAARKRAAAGGTCLDASVAAPRLRFGSGTHPANDRVGQRGGSCAGDRRASNRRMRTEPSCG